MFVGYSAYYVVAIKYVFYLLIAEFAIRYCMEMYKIVQRTYIPFKFTVLLFGLNESDGVISRCRLPASVLITGMSIKKFCEFGMVIFLSLSWGFWLLPMCVCMIIQRNPVGLFAFDEKECVPFEKDKPNFVPASDVVREEGSHSDGRADSRRDAMNSSVRLREHRLLEEAKSESELVREHGLRQ